MITVFSSAGCPFAHRTRALLNYMHEPFELREVDLDHRDPELLRLSPTGKVPFLLDGDFRVFESRVINDYLAEKYGSGNAYAEDVEVRALQKLLMNQWDSVILPAFYASLRQPASFDEELRTSLARELAWMSTTVSRMDGAVENLVGLHCATHWVRMDWLREFTPLPELIDEHPTLKRWLDRAAALPAIQETVPSREETVERYRRRYVQAAGS